MKDSHNRRLKGRFIFLWRWISYHTVGFAIWLIVFAVAPNLQAGQIIFSPGNPALASEVNANFGELYTLNPTAWTKSVSSDLGYTGGNLGVGIATPLAKFQVNGGSVITLAGATGFGVFGATTGSHVAIDTTQIQAKANATAVAHLSLNVLGGFVGVGTAPGVKFNVDNGTAVTTGSGGGYAAFGSATGQHVAIDTAQIQSKSNGTTPGNLILNPMGGNVGIGTAAPGTKLHVKGATDSDGTSLATIKATGGIIIENAASTSALNIDDNELNSSGLFYINTSNGNGLNVGGNVTVQSPTTVAGITIKGLGDGANSSYLKFSNNSASNAWQYSVRQGTPFNLDLSYYDGAAWSSLQVWNQSTGHIRLPGYGAGTLVTDASGNVTASSDARLKNIIGITQTGLSQVMALRGRRWHWKPDSGMDTAGTYEGFVAQDVQKLVPTAVGQDSKGYLSLSYVSLLPTFANAIRELKAEKDNQVIALEKRAHSAEQKLSVAVDQSNRDKAAADARIAALEKRLNDELIARKQQELRLAKLEQMLQRQVVARR